jgi:hypothetical protein
MPSYSVIPTIARDLSKPTIQLIMSESTLEVSKKFPEGYGDFALQSSDDIVCYFPRHILSHVSPVFQDMFNVNNHSDQRNATPQSVPLTELSSTVELFLIHLDPNALAPHIDPKTIEELMVMAHKYQTNVIIRWFEQEVFVQRAANNDQKAQGSFLSTHPALTLSLASRLDLTRTRDLAMAERLGCSSDLVADGINTLPNATYRAIIRHRKLRIQRYEKWIDLLAIGGDPREVPITCIRCSSKATWILRMSRSVQNSPSWSSFSKAYYGDGKCYGLWAASLLSGWAAVARKEESVLPADIF